MKKLALIFMTGLVLFGCNDKESDVATTDETMDNTTEAVVVDYSTMSLADQQDDMTRRIEELRLAGDNLEGDDKTAYETEVDNLEVKMNDFNEKKMESEADESNNDLRTAAQNVADEIRKEADRLKAQTNEAQADLQSEKRDLKADIKEGTDELKSDIKSTADEVQSEVQEEKEEMKSDIKEGKKEMKEDIKEAFGK